MQSQVTQLNSDFQNKIGFINAAAVSFELYKNRFLIYCYEDASHQNGIRFDADLENKSLTSLELKDGNPVYTSGFTIKSDLALLSFTWTGKATNYIDTSITIDGYKPIAITGLNPTGLGTGALRYFRFDKNNLRAIASFSTETVTSCVFDVLCIRI